MVDRNRLGSNFTDRSSALPGRVCVSSPQTSKRGAADSDGPFSGQVKTPAEMDPTKTRMQDRTAAAYRMLQ